MPQAGWRLRRGGLRGCSLILLAHMSMWNVGECPTPGVLGCSQHLCAPTWVKTLLPTCVQATANSMLLSRTRKAPGKVELQPLQLSVRTNNCTASCYCERRLPSSPAPHSRIVFGPGLQPCAPLCCMALAPCMVVSHAA